MSMPLTPTVVSPVLRETVQLKAEELASTKAAFKGRYDGKADREIAEEKNTATRLNVLLERIRDLDPYLERDDELRHMGRCVEQARDDRSMSEAKLLRLERELKEKLSQHACRLEVSQLHVDLLKQALGEGTKKTLIEDKMETMGLEDEFELVEGGLEDVREKFEKHTFTAEEVDTGAIEKYLESLFENKSAKGPLKGLREDMEEYGEDIISGKLEIDEENVEWCILDLIKNDLVSDEKKKTLQAYLQSPMALREITATMNTKSVQHWKWRGAEKGLPITARTNSEGKYCIAVEEDIIDMLFLHTLAVGWCMKLRECLKEAISFKGVWPGNKMLTAEELEKREYYLSAPRPSMAKSCSTCHPPPPPMPPMPMPTMHYMPPPKPRRRHGMPMPPPPPPPAPVYYGKTKKNLKKYSSPAPPPPPGPFEPNLNDERYKNYTCNFFLSRLPKRNGCVPELKAPEDTQAVLLKTLALELRIHETLNGSVHGLTANFEDFDSSLPHQTILTVLKFLGVSDRWLEMFTRFLAAPLNMGPVIRGSSDQILTRKRGVPLGHGFASLFGEAILVFLELAAHQKTGAYLFRSRDRCYFVGQEQQRDEILGEINKFAKVMHLTVNTSTNLSAAPIGHLRLATNPVTITIDDASVDAYAHRVKKQLDASHTALAWIKTWNATIGTYAGDLFGPPANIFGKAHHTAVTKAYNRIHDIIFGAGNLTAHVKALLAKHLNRPVEDPPIALEAIMYLPLAYGGLGIRNVYYTLSLVRDIVEDPSKAFEPYLEQEKKYYETAAETFNAMSAEKQADKLSGVFRDDKARIAAVLGADVDPAKFWSFEDFSSYRYRAALPYLPIRPYPHPPPAPTPSLVSTMTMLFSQPVDIIQASDKIADEVRRLAGKLDMRRLYKLCPEERWALQLYGEECFERYGGLEVWHGESVPRNVLRLVRGDWEDVEDDDSSVSSDMTDV